MPRLDLDAVVPDSSALSASRTPSARSRSASSSASSAARTPSPQSACCKRLGVGQLLDAVLEVDGVDESLHGPSGSAPRSATGVQEHLTILDTGKDLTLSV